MPKRRGIDAPGETEHYELRATSQPISNDDEPLLPQYERHNPASTSSSPTSKRRLQEAYTDHPDSRPTSPTLYKEVMRRPSRFRRAITCLCLAFLIVVPSFGFAGCWFGRRALERARTWEQIPSEWRDWLDTIVPGKMSHDIGNFPTDIGYGGPTPTGVEANLMMTAPALPMFTGVSPLVPPNVPTRGSVNIMQYWGNLSPYYSVDSHGLPDASRLVPETCEVEELHWLQRHGARYPTTQPDGPEGFAKRLSDQSGWTARGDLEFLNTYKYKMGREILTPFGRKQLFDLGVSARLKYGHLLEKMNGRLPVFRTESQDRMLRSAENFALGFFGYPADEQYNLEVMIEWQGFNCSLAPWSICDTTGDTSQHEGWTKIREWENVFLAEAVDRLNGMVDGMTFETRDVAAMMDTCAYETVSLGYSSFCKLFNMREWRGFEYRNDLVFWYTSSFGYPYSKAMGKAWVEELVSRLTHTRIAQSDSAINMTMHNDIQFPLNHPLYFDFTHDTEFTMLFPTMNLTTFAETGDPPSDHMPKHRSFIASKLTPFATNLQIQVLRCSDKTDRQIRLVLNDAAVPLTGINGCPEDDEGMCPSDTFVDGMKEIIASTDFAGTCGPKA